MRTSRLRHDPGRRAILKWSAVAVLLAAVGWLTWKSFAPPVAAAGAVSLATAVENRDARRLMGFVLPEEGAAGLTEAKLAQVLAGRPGMVIASLRPVGARDSRAQGMDLTNGSTGRWYATPKGTRFQGAVVSDLTEQGPASIVLHTVLATAWRADAADAGRGAVSPRYSELMLAGVRKDRAFLTSVGLEGMWLGPKDGFLTWDELEARYERRLAPQDAPPVATR